MNNIDLPKGWRVVAPDEFLNDGDLVFDIETLTYEPISYYCGRPVKWDNRHFITLREREGQSYFKMALSAQELLDTERVLKLMEESDAILKKHNRDLYWGC